MADFQLALDLVSYQFEESFAWYVDLFVEAAQIKFTSFDYQVVSFRLVDKFIWTVLLKFFFDGFDLMVFFKQLLL